MTDLEQFVMQVFLSLIIIFEAGIGLAMLYGICCGCVLAYRELKYLIYGRLKNDN